VKEFRMTKVNAVEVGTDGRLVRLEITTPEEGDIGVFLLAKNLPALIPALVKADALSREKQGLTETPAVFDVSEVAVNIPADKNGIVISLMLPQGLERGMGFRVDIETARRLSDTLDALVAQSGESPKKVQ